MSRHEFEVTPDAAPDVRSDWGDALGDDGAPYWEVSVPGMDLWSTDPAVLAAWLRAAADEVERTEACPAPAERDV